MKKLKMGHCLMGLAVAAILFVALGVDTGSLPALGLVLVCPLMMLLMMRRMSNGQGVGSGQSDNDLHQSRDDSVRSPGPGERR